MSHFSVLVITDEQPTDEALTKILQPWHEFECTGTDDEYVQNIDRTNEAREHYDGREDKAETAAASIEGWFGWKSIGAAEQPDLKGEHKYGYVRIGADGTIIEAIDRTNPNTKWDWWVVGGRWRGMLRMTASAEVRHVEQTGGALDFEVLRGDPGLMGSQYSEEGIDICQRRNLDFALMKTIAVSRRQVRWDATIAEAAKNGFSGTTEDLDALRREFYRARAIEMKQWSDGGDPRDRRAHYLARMPPNLLKWDKVFDDFMWPRSTDADKPVGEWIASAPALSTLAVVKDGKWYERGTMGWWGCVHDEKDEAAWEREFDALIQCVPPTHWLTVVDCHI